jgi:myo-inositol-1(or 4)-monophosphatase
MLDLKLKNLLSEAGEIFKIGFNTNKNSKNVDFKGKVDLVTEYDVKIEKILVEKLSVLYPDFQIIGEESTNLDKTQRDKKIYIDPIDGTTNFVHGIPFCAISIGFWKNNQPQTGVVYNPVLEQLFYAVKGKGSFLNDKKINVSNSDSLLSSLVSTGFPYTKVEQGEDYSWSINSFKNILPYTRDIRRLGSASLDLCLVAQGVFDGYFELNLKAWDVSAGILIVTEAGGKISNHEDKNYKIEQDRIIVASNSKIHSEIISKLDKTSKINTVE